MEKKTIGAFIAALRKANGMTQKDLAERLNVSDKTVSRWERDDGAPDLSLIPVIAEIFGVTCDELLRGERKSPEERAERSDESETEISQKGEKQRQRLLKAKLSQYQTLTYISMGISAVGMIVALICNLAFLKAVLGFLLGTVFFVASIVCQAVFLNQTTLSVEDAGLDELELSRFRRSVNSMAQKSIGLTVAFLGFTFPLILVDAYVGLGPDNLLIFGGIGTAAFLAVYAIAVFCINGSLISKGVYIFDETEGNIYLHNRSLKKRCASGVAIALVLTLVIHAVGSETLWNPRFMADGITFNDYESFIKYMEQDIPFDETPYQTGLFESAQDSATAPPQSSVEEIIGESTWYDEFGNEITEEEALTRKIEDANGDVVCTYIARNNAVSFIRYTEKDGSVLPIIVYTTSEMRTARTWAGIISSAVCLLYPAELLAGFVIYYRKRKQ